MGEEEGSAAPLTIALLLFVVTACTARRGAGGRAADSLAP